MNRTYSRTSTATKIEMIFWDLYIKTLEKSPFMRRAFRKLGRMIVRGELQRLAKTILLVALIGLISGISISILLFY